MPPGQGRPMRPTAPLADGMPRGPAPCCPVRPRACALPSRSPTPRNSVGARGDCSGRGAGASPGRGRFTNELGKLRLAGVRRTGGRATAWLVPVGCHCRAGTGGRLPAGCHRGGQCRAVTDGRLSAGCHRGDHARRSPPAVTAGRQPAGRQPAGGSRQALSAKASPLGRHRRAVTVPSTANSCSSTWSRASRRAPVATAASPSSDNATRGGRRQ